MFQRFMALSHSAAARDEREGTRWRTVLAVEFMSVAKSPAARNPRSSRAALIAGGVLRDHGENGPGAAEALQSGVQHVGCEGRVVGMDRQIKEAGAESESGLNQSSHRAFDLKDPLLAATRAAFA